MITRLSIADPNNETNIQEFLFITPYGKINIFLDNDHVILLILF